jgi:hypothetical protein
MVQAKVRQQFLNFLNPMSKSYNFCGVALDVKMGKPALQVFSLEHS